MTDASRRAFLVATGTTAAAAAALAATPAAYAATPATAPQSGPEHPDLVVHVPSGSSGLLTVLVGEHEVVVRDRALVRSLLRAARS